MRKGEGEIVSGKKSERIVVIESVYEVSKMNEVTN